MHFLNHDWLAKFSAGFDSVFMFEGLEIVLTPPQTPNANAVTERWIRTVREECLDHLLIFGERHLPRALQEYITYYNPARPHQSLEQQASIPFAASLSSGPIRRQDVLKGLIHDYYRATA